mmetsp:Transcript_114703/g.180589  ORF Transcript_114703/g.180589 Transcript_114703/m.180589 type:complete len:244 (-) Transcript_114703:89-820(-)
MHGSCSALDTWRSVILLSLVVLLGGAHATSLRSSMQNVKGFAKAAASGSPAELEEEEDESMDESSLAPPMSLATERASHVQSISKEKRTGAWLQPHLAIMPQTVSVEEQSPVTQPKILASVQKNHNSEFRHLQKANTDSMKHAMPTDECSPPCLEGRGVCSNHICFCKSPFIGSTCQHDDQNLFRVSHAATAGISIACVVLGICIAKVLSAQIVVRRSSNALAGYGTKNQKHELWQPSSHAHH